MSLFIKKLVVNACTPTRGSKFSAGYDLYSAENITVKTNNRSLISIGLAIKVPEGYYGRIASRSGLAVKYGIDVGAGVIDSDYTGPVKVLLFNHGDEDFVVSEGDRIAQLIIEKIAHLNINLVNELT
jgi:deoxyuridine 5'-triphosphate nucleotidohydrolase